MDLEELAARVGVVEQNQAAIDEAASLAKLDAHTTRNRVTNLLQRMEPRVALIEEVLIGAGMLERNEKGELVKKPDLVTEKAIQRSAAKALRSAEKRLARKEYPHLFDGRGRKRHTRNVMRKKRGRK